MKNRKKYAQMYLEEWNYKAKKKNMSKFIDAELELDVDCDSE